MNNEKKILGATKNNEEDNKAISEIKKILSIYPLALFKDDMEDKTWDNPENVAEAALEAIKLAIWDLRTDKEFAKHKIDLDQIKLAGDYVLDLNNNKLQTYICYKQSKAEIIVLHTWNNVTITELITKLNEEIKNKIISKQYVETDWDNHSYIFELAKKYEQTLANKLPKTIKINEQNVIVNWKFIHLKSYEKNIRERSTITLKYNYLNISDEPLNLEIKLIPKPKITDYTKKIISFLETTNIFKDAINITINWQNPEEYQAQIEKVKNKLEQQISVISKQLNLLDVDNLELPEWKIHIKKTSILGPLENKLIVYFSINNNRNLIPVTFNFINDISAEKILKLEKSLNQKLKTIYIKKSNASTFKNETWLQLIKLKIKNKIWWDNQEVPFSSDQLLVVKSLQTNDNQQKIFLKLIQNVKEMEININLI